MRRSLDRAPAHLPLPARSDRYRWWFAVSLETSMCLFLPKYLANAQEIGVDAIQVGLFIGVGDVGVFHPLLPCQGDLADIRLRHPLLTDLPAMIFDLGAGDNDGQFSSGEQLPGKIRHAQISDR